MPIDISNKLGNVNLEKSALDKFGAAVNDKSKLSFGNTQSPQGVGSDTNEPSVWDPTPYASALVAPNTVPYNPKLKFMFKVSFKFDPAVIDMAAQMGHDIKALQENLTFVVRHVDRPKHDFEYEEVNMYNFRTQVLKSIKNREVGLTIYDDVGNNALSFTNVYRKLLQPITRFQQMPSLAHEDFGFSFGGQTDTSLRAVLPGGAKSVLTEMTIHQIYVERGENVSNPSSLVKVVNFVFMNPRFTNIDIDDLDHEGTNFNVVTFSVNYDSVFMDQPQSFTSETGGPNYNVGDIPQNGKGGSSAMGGGGRPQNYSSDRIMAGDPYYDISGGGGGRGVDMPVGGTFQEAGQRSVDGMMANTMSPFSRAGNPPIIDNTTSPSIAKDLTSQFGGDIGVA